MTIAIITSNTDMNEFDMTHDEIKTFVDGEVRIVVSRLSHTIPIAKELEKKGAEVLIARGVTAICLRNSDITIPVVELPITLQDLSNALLKTEAVAGTKKPRVGIVVFHMLEDVEALFPLLEFDMRCFSLNSQDEIDRVIDEALAESTDVLLGGVLVFEAAKRRGVPAVLIQSGREALLLAVREARAVASARRHEQQQAEEFQAILNYAYGGIIAVNSEGLVSVFNTVAERITGIKAEEILNRPAEKLLPRFKLNETLVRGETRIDDFVDIGKAKVLMNWIPIKVNEAVTGVVSTFQEVAEIEKMEKKIRRNIYSKGLVAKFSFEDICGKSSLLKETKWKAREFARTDSAVLITGETGVGKELFAQSIHRVSPRGNAPFVAVNCAALPENLLESELFGYVEGAFTGAARKGKKGIFELAHEGTIFLDEISEIPLSLQGRLLRVLQESEVMRLGHDRVIPIDIRVICATNRDLGKLVKEGAFRDDLFWRLNVLNLFIPPLRQRKDDIFVLLNHFLKGFRKEISFSKGGSEFLLTYSWPGNVRELANFCERLAVMIPDHEVVSLDRIKNILDVSENVAASGNELFAGESRDLDPDILLALERAAGNKTRAAEILGVHRVTLWRYLKKYAAGREYLR